MIDIAHTILKMYPNIVNIVDTTAYDSNGNEVAYDLQAVTAQVEVDKQNAINIRNSALAKLAALGLTQDEVKSLIG